MTANEPHPDGRDADDSERRERRAVDNATATRLQPGVRQDSHGELAPDPFPDDQDPDADADQVIARHRAHADDVERAATRGPH